MKIIAGLGNPGTAYQKTRHNIGAAIVKALAAEYRVSLKRGFLSSALCARIKVRGNDVLLAVPLLFMNLSGAALAGLVKKHKTEPSQVLVIHDDLDLELGRIKLKLGGSSAGHNGLKSVISALGREDFCRLRIGIGRPKNKNIESADYVLAPFSKKEAQALDEIKENASLAVTSWAGQGLVKTMNDFNQRGKNEQL